jgi:hypothetical protein
MRVPDRPDHLTRSAREIAAANRGCRWIRAQPRLRSARHHRRGYVRMPDTPASPREADTVTRHRRRCAPSAKVIVGERCSDSSSSGRASATERTLEPETTPRLAAQEGDPAATRRVQQLSRPSDAALLARRADRLPLSFSSRPFSTSVTATRSPAPPRRAQSLTHPGRHRRRRCSWTRTSTVSSSESFQTTLRALIEAMPPGVLRRPRPNRRTCAFH